MNESRSHKLPKIILLGAAGKMGRSIAPAFLKDSRVNLVGAVDIDYEGVSIGTLVNSDVTGPVIVKSVENLPKDITADIVLDFSTPKGTIENLPACLDRGWDVLIGVTGFTDDNLSMFRQLADSHERRVVLVPNFTIGVNILLKFAREAAKVFDSVEIIELHHDRKDDAPSGTALHTAQEISAERDRVPPRNPNDPSRGRVEHGIPIHAVRLPGLLAHQEVMFGSQGEVLTIRHDTTDRSAFLTGIYLAIDKLPDLKPGFLKGLDWVFD